MADQIEWETKVRYQLDQLQMRVAARGAAYTYVSIDRNAWALYQDIEPVVAAQFLYMWHRIGDMHEEMTQNIRTIGYSR